MQPDAVGSEAGKPVCHAVSSRFIVKVGIEAGIGSPKSNSSLIGGEMSIGDSDKSVFTGRGIEPLGYIGDIIGSVKGDDERKQFAAEC
jgi:hypothetical protein